MQRNLIINLYKSNFIKNIYSFILKIPLLGTIASWILHIIYPNEKKIWIKFNHGILNGFQFYIDPRTESGYLNGDHEPWVQNLLHQELNNGDCFYDIGAHKGFFSLIAKVIVGNEGQVFSFEPDPDNAYVFTKIIEKNKINQISIIDEAVYSISGNFIFKKAPKGSNLTQGYIDENNIENDINIKSEHILITTTSLDDFVYKQEHPPPNMIKIDVEGAEKNVLIGSKKLLKYCRPKLLIEIHNTKQIGEFKEFLSKYDYSVKHINPKHPIYSNYKQEYLIALP